MRLISSQFMATEETINQIPQTGRTAATHDALWSFLLKLTFTVQFVSSKQVELERDQNDRQG